MDRLAHEVCKITVEGDNTNVVFADSDADAENSAHLFEFLLRQQIDEPTNLVLDLRNATRLSSAMVGEIFRLSKLSRSMGKNVRLVNISPTVCQSLTIMQMNRLAILESQ